MLAVLGYSGKGKATAQPGHHLLLKWTGQGWERHLIGDDLIAISQDGGELAVLLSGVWASGVRVDPAPNRVIVWGAGADAWIKPNGAAPVPVAFRSSGTATGSAPAN